MSEILNNHDIEVQWLINDICNFRCAYCWLQNEPKGRGSIGLEDTQSVISGFNNKGVTWLIHMSGGEPFLFPNFIELCRELTKNHFISINTNLAHEDIRHFAETIDPGRVNFMHASLHIAERRGRNNIKRFIDNYKIVRNSGFHIFASYLMYPNLFGRFKRDYDFFRTEGIILHPKVFRGDFCKIFDSPVVKKLPHINKFGEYTKRSYPNAYTRRQKKFIKHYVDQSAQDEGLIHDCKSDFLKNTIDLSLDKILADGPLSFKGKRCSAGRKALKMEKGGELYRCNDETQYYLGNMFSGPIKLLEEDLICSSETCSCPYVGIKYAYG